MRSGVGPHSRCMFPKTCTSSLLCQIHLNEHVRFPMENMPFARWMWPEMHRSSWRVTMMENAFSGTRNRRTNLNVG